MSKITNQLASTESVNFIHDVNVLRKTLKSVYGGSADLQALNSEIDKLPKNCRLQGKSAGVKMFSFVKFSFLLEGFYPTHASISLGYLLPPIFYNT